MAHQKKQPTVAYTGGERGNTELVLGVLAYYTANGAKPYCDRKSPTGTDRVWARLSVQLGSAAENVAPILEAR